MLTVAVAQTAKLNEWLWLTALKFKLNNLWPHNIMCLEMYDDKKYYDIWLKIYVISHYMHSMSIHYTELGGISTKSEVLGVYETNPISAESTSALD